MQARIVQEREEKMSAAEFDRVAAELARLKAAKAPKEAVQPVLDRLLKLKAEHASRTRRRKGEPRHSKRKRSSSPAGSRACHNYPPKVDQLPAEPADPAYAAGFDPETQSAEAAAFLADWGYVVFRDVLTPAECAATRAEIFGHVEAANPGFAVGRPETWDVLSSKTYGLPRQQTFFSPELLANRQRPRVLAALRAALGSNDILVSHDRFCTYRPAGARPEWRTKGNLHLDLHPWKFRGGGTAIEELPYKDDVDFITEINAAVQSSGPHVQGVLNLHDNVNDDGGTLIVPRFPQYFDQWAVALGAVEDNMEVHTSSHLVGRRQGGGSYKFAEGDPIYRLAHRVPLREGSLLLWDQRTVHGSQPNKSARWRIAQFLRAFKSEHMSSARRTARAAAVLDRITRSGTLELLTAEGRRVCGLSTDAAS